MRALTPNACRYYDSVVCGASSYRARRPVPQLLVQPFRQHQRRLPRVRHAGPAPRALHGTRRQNPPACVNKPPPFLHRPAIPARTPRVIRRRLPGGKRMAVSMPLRLTLRLE
jgi:hypothetical protein